MTSTASDSTAPPVFPCPYTAGGCPLFNTIELPKPQAPTCAGACSPAPSPASTSTPGDPSLKLRPISPQLRAPSPGRLPPLEVAAPYPRPEPSQVAKEWNGYLEFGLQPSEVDLAPLYVPFPAGGLTQELPVRQKSPRLSRPDSRTKRTASTSGLWDIEELVPNLAHETATKKPRIVPTVPTLFPGQPAVVPLQEPLLPSGLSVPFDQTRASPGSGSEDGLSSEVVTPFISKLTYLLEHSEYQSWIRWDTSGTSILIAHTKPRLLEILARYFRHTTISSFVRQLNIYGFKRLSTVALLALLESTQPSESVLVSSTSPTSGASTSTSTTASTFNSPQNAFPSIETFSASDYSAFHHPAFFRSTTDNLCKLGLLKPITKERVRTRKTKTAARVAKEAQQIDAAEVEARRVLAESVNL